VDRPWRLSDALSLFEDSHAGRLTPTLAPKDLAALRDVTDRPKVVIADTVKGKGVSFMEDDYKWHGIPPSRDQADQALREMGTSLEEWTARLERHTQAEVAPGAGALS